MRCRVNLNKLAVSVEAPLLIKRRLRRSRTNHRIRRLAKDRADSAGRNNDCVGRERAHLHRAQIHRAYPATHPVPIQHRRQEFPVLVLLNLAFRLVSPDLLVQRIEQLLPGRRSGKGGAVVQSPAKPPEIEQAFRRSVEGHAHAIQQINDPGRRLAHVLDRRLIAQKISAIHRVVKVLPGGIAFALQILRRIDAALRAHGMRSLHWNNREQIDATAHLRDLDDCRQSGEPAAHDNDFGIRHYCTGLP